MLIGATGTEVRMGEPLSGSVAAADAPRFLVRRHATLDKLAPLWRDWQEAGAVGAYQRLEWVELLLAHLGGPARARPLFLEVREAAGDRPVMILPLVLRWRRGLRRLAFLDLMVCDYAAPLLAPDRELSPAEAEAAFAAIRAVLPKADLLEITRIPATVGGRPNPLAHLARHRPIAMTSSGIAIEGEAETLLRRLMSASAFKDLGKRRRRLERAGTLRFERAATPEAVERTFAALVEQRRRRFGEMGRFDLLARPEVLAFYRDAALLGLSSGAARLFGLWVDETPVAAAYGLVHGGAFHGLLLTLSGDEAWRNASPGLQIVGECLRWSRAEGLDYFDFTIGDLPYKRDFGTEPRALGEIALPLTPAGRIALGAARLREAAMRRLGEHPAAHARLQKARRLARRLGIG
ncbi:acetyltransferase [Aureimonas endophytica]|uniref:Acetyltransferase n=1 Tax=Aureimonas endophytica TaxID=2027858 RepID=A0A917E728_9HYPH|nr:GNAT family N-acetyltransferase [Aureimonas endophytica]GGE10634.1 acetyltransferase [Aureimonas endophytica]